MKRVGNGSRKSKVFSSLNLILGVLLLIELIVIVDHGGLTGNPVRSPILGEDESVLASQSASKLDTELSPELSAKYGGGWKIKRDKTTNLPDSIYGSTSVSKIKNSITKVDKSNAGEVTKQFLRDNYATLGIDADSIYETAVYDDSPTSNPSQRIVATNFKQKYNGLRVIGGKVMVDYVNDKLVYVRSKFKPNINLDINPKLTKEQAFEIAKNIEVNQLFMPKYPRESQKAPQKIPLEQIKLERAELVVYPIKNAKDVYVLAWKIDFEVTKNPGSQLTYLIDANDGGYLLRADNLMYAFATGSIEGSAYSGDMYLPHGDIYYPGGERILDPYNPFFTGFKGIEVEAIDGSTGIVYASTLTDENGFYELYDSSGNADTIRYAFSEVVDFNGFPSRTAYFPNTTFGDRFEPFQSQNIDFSRQDSSWNFEASTYFYHLLKLREFFSRGGIFDVEIGKLYLDVDPGLSEGICGNFNSETNTIKLSTDPDCSYAFGSEDYPIVSVLYHEFAHAVRQVYYEDEVVSCYFSGLFKDCRAIDEALSYYWEGTLNKDYRYKLENDLRFPEDYSGFWDLNSAHADGKIITGALGDARKKFIEIYGVIDGAGKMDELVLLTTKKNPLFFETFMESLLLADDEVYGDGNIWTFETTPHAQQICEAFYTNHGIWHDICAMPPMNMDPPEYGITPLPEGPIYSDVNFPFDGSYFSSSFPIVVGSAGVTNGSGLAFTQYILEKKPYHYPDSLYNSAGVVRENGGLSQVLQNRLGTISTNGMTNGCFYNAKLTTQTSGADPSEVVTFEKVGGTVDPMPRMVCVARTDNKGAEEDACEFIAIVSDPKKAYFSLSTQDWRRGRYWLLQPKPNKQIGGDFSLRNMMCDPDNGRVECIFDCWNIIGSKGNNNGGNDGIDSVFCGSSLTTHNDCGDGADGNDCDCTVESPPSFSGCESSDSTCVLSALNDLESVYHKVIYYHWTESGERASCDEDGTFLGSDNAYFEAGNLYRQAQCSEPRCDRVIKNDPYDRFSDLNTEGVNFGFTYVGFEKLPREPSIPRTNCYTCGCPGDIPYCNSAADVCEAKCWDGQPFNTCKSVIAGGVSAAYYCDLEHYEDYNAYWDNTKYVCDSLCPSAQCPTVTISWRPTKLVCNTALDHCVQCNSNADCDDKTSCTTDVCNNPGQLSASCSHTNRPNDCPASQQCGPSPSGCFTCGQSCGLGKICSPLTKTCVDNPDVKCDPKKTKCDDDFNAKYAE